MKTFWAKFNDVRGAEIKRGEAKTKKDFTYWAKAIQKERGWGHVEIYDFNPYEHDRKGA